MSAKFWLVDKFLEYSFSGIFALEADTLKLMLADSTLASEHTAWAGSTAYSAGDVRIPTTRNGHRYICTVAGASSSTEPTWPTTDDGTVTDGTATWAEYGGDLCTLDIIGDVSGSEVANGSGYTTGGASLANVAITTTYKACKIDADDVTLSSLTKTFRTGWIYKSGTVSGIVSPIIGYILFDDSFADKAISGIDFWVQFSSSTGIATVTVD